MARINVPPTRSNLLRMKQELALTEEEVAAVDDGLSALDTLQEKLADTPTPAGANTTTVRGEPPAYRLHCCANGAENTVKGVRGGKEISVLENPLTKLNG